VVKIPIVAGKALHLRTG